MQLLVFVSSHCPHCPKAVTAVKEAVSQYSDYNLSYRKIRARTVEAKQISGKYGIRAYPTIIGLNDSEETVCKIVGVPSEEKLRKEIEKALGLRKSLFRKIFGART